MRKLLRPEEPNIFKNDVSTASEEVSKNIAQKKDPEFPGIWSKFKQEFTEAQLGKCGFCESHVLGMQYGDVEHFQPKAEVHELDDDPDRWGTESLWKSSVEGRYTKKNIIKPGYWWRAYEWDNYLLSCQICNQQWKQNLYPVDGPRVLTKDAETTEIPLLLSPFDTDPENHFAYGRLGEIWGLTVQGRATIVTCGLDRPSLRLARYKTARVTHERLDEIAGSITEREMLRLLRYIAEDGKESQAFCGMVKTIFFQRTKLRWENLGEIICNLEKSRVKANQCEFCGSVTGDSAKA